MFFVAILFSILRTDAEMVEWILRGRGSCTSSIFFEQAISVDDCRSACETEFYCDLILWLDDNFECYISSSTSCELSDEGGWIWELVEEETPAPMSASAVIDWNMVIAIALVVLVLGMLILIYCQRHRLCSKSEFVMTQKEIELAARDPLFISLRDASLEEHYQTLIKAGWNLDALLNLKNGTPLEKSCALDAWTASSIYLRVLLPLAQEIEDMASEIRLRDSCGSFQRKEFLGLGCRSPNNSERYLKPRDGKQPMKGHSINRARGMEVDIELAKIHDPEGYTRRVPPMPILSEHNSNEVSNPGDLYVEPVYKETPHMHTRQDPHALTPQMSQEDLEGQTEGCREYGEGSGERFTVKVRALPDLPDYRESSSQMEGGREGERKLGSTSFIREHKESENRWSRQSVASVV